MSNFGRQAKLEEELRSISYRCQLAFSAAVAERLLPVAKPKLDAWRPVAWPTHRNALNKIWDFLEGKRLSMEKYNEIREACDDQLPNDEDPNWPGGYGGFEAGAAVAYALDVLIDSNAINAARAGNQPFNAMREYLIDKLFPCAKTHREINEDAIDNSTLFKREVEIQDRHINMLMASDANNKAFTKTVKEIKEESADSPVVLE